MNQNQIIVNKNSLSVQQIESTVVYDLSDDYFSQFERVVGL